MILALILIILFSLFVFYAIKLMIKRGHDIFAMAFFALYVYTIFAQIGYAFFPELSILMGAYFGPSLFYKYWIFMFFSFFFTFLLYRKINPINQRNNSYNVKMNYRKSRLLFYLIVIILYLILNYYFQNNRALFGWGGGSPMGDEKWFVIGFRIFTVCTLILYTLFRNKSNKLKTRRLSLIFFIFSIIFFLSVAIAAGTRSDILYFSIAIALYELSPLRNSIKFQKKKIIILFISGVFIINMLSVLLILRTTTPNISFSSFINPEKNDSQSSSIPLSAQILMQDYYAPSHTLFISMHYGIIDPVEVFKSNFANSLVKFNYPYLSSTIVEKIGSINERGAGWSYMYFVEGYNALGWLGIFYNAIFWNLGMLLWTRLIRSNNNEHNNTMQSILGLVIVMVSRGQTGSFIQFYWMLLLPSLVLLLLATNSTITFNTKTFKTKKR